MDEACERLRAALATVEVRDMKRLSSRWAPWASWDEVRSRAAKYRDGGGSASLARAIADVVRRKRPNLLEVEAAARNLALVAKALSDKSEWRAYRLAEPKMDAPNMESIASRLEEAFGRRAVVVVVECDSDPSWTLLSVESSSRSVLVACLKAHRVLIRSPQPKPATLQLFVDAIGYGSIKDSHLSGRHVPSILKTLERKRNYAHFQAESDEAYPRCTPYGLDFIAETPKIVTTDADNEDTPRLPRLTIDAKDGTGLNGEIQSRAVLRSSNVEASLHEMVAAKIISPHSQFFTMLMEYGKSDIKVKLVSE